MVNYYTNSRKTLRWYQKVVFHLLNITIWNTFYLHESNFKCYTFQAVKRFNYKKLFANFTYYKQQFNYLTLKKNKVKPVLLESNHYQELITVPKNFQRSKYFKNFKECIKNKTNTFAM